MKKFIIVNKTINKFLLFVKNIIFWIDINTKKLKKNNPIKYILKNFYNI